MIFIFHVFYVSKTFYILSTCNDVTKWLQSNISIKQITQHTESIVTGKAHQTY